MTDWSKQKVPELRTELKKRGLPQNGLKAELVARLTAADNESGFESEATIKGDSQEVAAETSSLIDGAVEGNSTSDKIQTEKPVLQSQSLPQESLPLPASTNNSSADAINIDPLPQAEHKPPSRLAVDASKSTVIGTESSSRLPAVDPEEAVEDKQKRKRRSKSPPPSAADIRRKRARPDEEISSVDSSSGAPNEEFTTTIANAKWVENRNAVDIDMVNNEPEVVPGTQADEQTGSTGMELAEEEMNADLDVVAETEAGRSENPEMHIAPAIAPVPDLPPDGILSHKNKDSRFKDLFSAQTSSFAQDINPEAVDAESAERYVAPSIHPATSALYIRDFMRPLNAGALKEHLTILATAPGTVSDPDTIADFYIDPIRTHAFISFKSVSAASRVRSELHDQIWPEERTRKPLWADFIPPQRVLEWIAEEQSSSTGVRTAGRKWEVIYNTDEEGTITATLQETGNFTPLVRKPSMASAPPAAPARSGIEGAPSGPRAQHYNGPRAPSSGSKLDQLFRHTIAKPVLYYQPVSKELAERRLGQIRDAAGKHHSTRTAGPDINRYTFEEGDVLVDRGPEIFSGIRRPGTERGRGGGGGGGRGGFGQRHRGGDRYEGSGRDRGPRDRGPRDRRY
jgi:hypothetical protein